MMTWLRGLGRWGGWLIAAALLLTGATLTLPSLLPLHHPLVPRAAVVARARELVGPTAGVATKYVQESDLRILGEASVPKDAGQGFWVVASTSEKLFFILPCRFGCTPQPLTVLYFRDDQAGLDRLGLGPTVDPTGFSKLPDRAFAEWLPSTGSYWWGTVLAIGACLLGAWMWVTRSRRTPAIAVGTTSPATAGTR